MADEPRAMVTGTPALSRRPILAGALAVMAALGAVPSTGHALPVIPGLIGPGSGTPAGRGGVVYRVTHLNDSGVGSLRACVDASGARVCIFETSGVIRLAQDLKIRNPKLTIAGQTAPAPGITLRGAGLLVAASDVLVQHLHVRPGDDPAGANPDNRDALKIEQVATSPLSNVVIDHCSFTWAIDETASAWSAWNNIVLTNNIFAEALNDSLHSKGPHGYGVLFGPVQGDATMIGNLLAHQVERNPLSAAARLVFVNNVVYDRANADVVLSTGGYQTFNTVAGNAFLRGPSYARSGLPVQVYAGGSTALPSGSKLYVSDNDAAEATLDPWSVVGSYSASSGSVSPYKSATPPVWPANLLRMPAMENVTLGYVLKFAGARPAERDPVDRRIVEQVRTRTGRIINCVAPNGTARCQLNAGGWPTVAQNYRALTLPAEPNATTASGYTNLELWLHKMASAVEGRGPAPLAPTLKN